MNFVIGTAVKVAHDSTIPVRYHGRTGFVVGTTPKGRGVQYLVEFPGRRATPLVLAKRFISVTSV